MKKNLLLFSALFCLLFGAVAQDDDAPLDRGFYLKLGLNMPSSSYLTPDISFDDDDDFDLNFKPGLHFEIGNKFPIGPVIADQFRFGLDVTWFSFNTNSGDLFLGLVEYRTVHFQPLKLGPAFSYAINDDMAVDLKYSIVPNYGFGVITADGEVDDDVTIFSGILNEIGLDFRWKVLSVGFAYQFGTMSGISSDSDIEDFAVDYKSNTLRLLLGVKF